MYHRGDSEASNSNKASGKSRLCENSISVLRLDLSVIPHDDGLEIEHAVQAIRCSLGFGLH